FLEELHRAYDPFVHVMVCALAAALASRFGAALPGDARVISAVVGRLQPGRGCQRGCECLSILWNLVRQREYKAANRSLVLGLNLENSVADALAFSGLVQ